MIKLDIPARPVELTDELVSQSTREFKNTQKPVWKAAWLLDAVSAMAFNKCCYSEVRLGEESKYMEVEHFHPKSLYPDEVMAWGNLLPACKKCNATKGEHDTVNQPVVNPFVDDPQAYFYFENSFYRVKGSSPKGKLTIQKLGLNDIEHFVKPRARISEAISKTLNDLYEDFSCSEPTKYAIYAERFKRLLQKGNRKEEYAALVSTTILLSNDFKRIEEMLKTHNRWSEELERLKEELLYCALLK
jgi:uncharacterized protein (TIGR02646 family)